jgi:hypothetical protein
MKSATETFGGMMSKLLQSYFDHPNLTQKFTNITPGYKYTNLLHN